MESLLINCIPINKNKPTYFNKSNRTNAGQLLVSSTNVDSLCFFENELINILGSTNIGNYNITYKTFGSYSNEGNFFQEWNADMILDSRPINEYLLGFSDAHWHRDEYSFTILSSLFIEPPKLVNMLKLFTLDVWLGLLFSILAVTAYDIVKDRLYDSRNGAINISKIWNKLFMISRNLLNQGPKNSKCFVINFWALLAVIFISSFSGNILTILIAHDIKPINSFEELIQSKLKIIVANKTNIYYGIKYADSWNDEKFVKLQSIYSRIIWLPNFWSNEADIAIQKLANDNKALVIGDSLNINLKRLVNIKEPVAIGEHQYNFNYMGFPINKKSKHHHRIYKIMRDITEHGINLRPNLFVFLLHEYRGRRKQRSTSFKTENFYKNDGNVQINAVNLKLVQELFMLIGMCYAVSIFVILIEKVL